MQKNLLALALAVLVGILIGTNAVLFRDRAKKPPSEDLIREYYEVENAVKVSPHGLRKLMDKGDQSFVLVDLRSPQEYEKEHVVGAVNIAAYTDPNTTAYHEKDRILSQFRALPQDKDIIVYCYSTPCMTGRKIGLMLAENGLFVKHLGIGWNEWRYEWRLWNHEPEWEKTKPEDYVVSGKEPGEPKKFELPSPCGEGPFSC